MAAALLGSYATAVVEGKDEASPFPAIAEAARVSAGFERLAELAESWARLAPEDLEREARLRKAYREASDANRLARTAHTIEAAREWEPDLSASDPGLQAVLLFLEIGRAYERQSMYAEGLERLDAAARIAGSWGARSIRADALREAGSCTRTLGRFPETLERWEAEREELEALGDGIRLAHNESSLGSLHTDLGNFERARELLERALARQEELGDKEGAARTLSNLGNLHRRTGAFSEALDCFERSLREREALGDRRGAAVVLGNLGNLYQNRGDLRLAIESYEAALEAFQALGERTNVARALGNLGNACTSAGEYARALDFLERARVELEAIGDRLVAARTLANLAGLERRLGRPERAVELLERAIREQEEMGDRTGAAAARFTLGLSHLDLGDEARALAHLEDALETYEAIGDRRGRARVLENLSLVHRRRGEFETALRLIETALEIHEETTSLWGRARALGTAGVIEDALGRPERAIARLERAVRECERVGDRARTAWTMAKLSTCLARAEQPERALELARRVIGIWSETGEGLGEEEAWWLRDANRDVVDAALGILADRLDDRGGTSAVEEAWEFAEAGRGVLLAELLRNREALRAAILPAELRDAESSARARVGRAQRQLLRAAAGGDPDAVLAARGELDEAYRTLESAVSRVNREARRAAELAFPRTIDLPGLREALPDDTALLLYHATADDLLLLVVDGTSASAHRLGPAAGLLASAQEYLDLASVDGASEAPLARRLYAALLAPAEPSLLGRRRLLVSPDGPLSFLPLEALLRGDEGEEERVLERWEVAYVPSGTVYASLRGPSHPAGRGWIAVGDPIPPRPGRRIASLRGGTFGRLPGSAAEVREIAALFPPEESRILLREDASRSGLLDALGEGRRASVHFACHGLIDGERPSLSGLVLSDGEVLTLDDIYGLEVSASCVVLSACETAHGTLRSGEGVVGLVRGFFFAGAPRVVVSNWRVADEGTRALMTAFYRAWIRDGEPPAAALRRAKLEALRRGGADAHPYRWAAFVLWGLPE